jgi:hypothetical protein
MRRQAKTLIEKLGFMDIDRKDSGHDEVQFWGYNNIAQVLNSSISDGSEITSQPQDTRVSC